MSSFINEGKLHPPNLFTNGQAEVVNALSDSWLEKTNEWLMINVGRAMKEEQCEWLMLVSYDTDQLTYFFIIFHT